MTPAGRARVWLTVRACAGTSSCGQNIDTRVLPAGNTRVGVNLHMSGTVAPPVLYMYMYTAMFALPLKYM